MGLLYLSAGLVLGRGAVVLPERVLPGVARSDPCGCPDLVLTLVLFLLSTGLGLTVVPLLPVARLLPVSTLLLTGLLPERFSDPVTVPRVLALPGFSDTLLLRTDVPLLPARVPVARSRSPDPARVSPRALALLSARAEAISLLRGLLVRPVSSPACEAALS